MRVALVERFGGPEVLVPREVPDPVPAREELVVGVVAAEVLWVETMVRRGAGRPHFEVAPPYVPGSAVAGRVRSAGEGVDPSWVDRAVVARTGGRGGYAEQVAVPVDTVVPVPHGLGLSTAA